MRREEQPSLQRMLLSIQLRRNGISCSIKIIDMVGAEQGNKHNEELDGQEGECG
jgi:hypothetical protein